MNFPLGTRVIDIDPFALSLLALEQLLIEPTIKKVDKSLSKIEDIKFDVSIDVGYLDLDTLHPLGLLINEVVSNSIKYAFNGSENKKIYLHLNQVKNEYELSVGDLGIGLDKNSSSFNTNSIGLELISSLSEQLGGEIERTVDNGTHYNLTFKTTSN